MSDEPENLPEFLWSFPEEDPIPVAKNRGERGTDGELPLLLIGLTLGAIAFVSLGAGVLFWLERHGLY